MVSITHDRESQKKTEKHFTLSHSARSKNEIRYDGWKSLISRLHHFVHFRNIPTPRLSSLSLSLYLSMKYDDDSIGSGRRDDFSKGNVWKGDANKSRCKMDRLLLRCIKGNRELMDKRDRPFKGGHSPAPSTKEFRISSVSRRSILFPSKTEVSNARSGNRTELYIAVYM
ncbi:hypothetical protein ACFW04_010198 [Cataglyphis niger]